MLKKKNCWEYMQCGREPGGLNAEKAGVCPAAVDTTHDGINSGSCGGRFCWAVTGTLCSGKVQGSFAEKRESCTQCLFYKQVRAEEGSLNIRTKFLRFVRPCSKTSIFRNLAPERIRQGTRFVLQGCPADSACIIQQGSCILLVEKKGALYPVGHRGEGDIVGMISLLTGEPSGFHVEAETDMDVWVIRKKDIDLMPDQDPELFAFLTELTADRLDRKGPMAERTIGKYIITDILGKGGYSIVYKGFHSELGQPVAVKMMRHHFSMQTELMQNFQNEAKLIAGLNHENIIRVFDIESRFKTVFIIYEFLDGESLADLILRLKRIPPQLALTYLCQMVSALAYAAEKGLVHRDINPSNVIVLQHDRIKLIDFGLAGPIGTDDFQPDGNFHYLAPELIDGEPADFRTDIFSLGLTAFHMVSGRLPLLSENPAELMKMMRTRAIPDPGKQVEDLPEILRQFILTACSRDPDQRFQTPKQAQAFLSNGIPVKKIHPALPGKALTRTLTFEIQPGREEEFSRLIHELDQKLAKINSRIRESKKGKFIIKNRKTFPWDRKQDHFETENLVISAQTDMGLVRRTNQDRYGIKPFSDGTVIMGLADGLGGEPGGEIAACHVMESLENWPGPDGKNTAASLMDFFIRMDREIVAMAAKKEALSGMATTLILVAVKGRQAVFAHSGDSRLYHYRAGNLTQITQDQTLARFLMVEGELSGDEAQAHYSRNVPDQCLGCRDLTPETGEIRLETGDILVLMSDGVHGAVEKEMMAEVLKKADTCDHAADHLIRLALAAGGNDNMTVVLGKFR